MEFVCLRVVYSGLKRPCFEKNTRKDYLITHVKKRQEMRLFFWFFWQKLPLKFKMKCAKIVKERPGAAYFFSMSRRGLN